MYEIDTSLTIFEKKIDIAQKISSTVIELLIAGLMCHFFRSMQTGLRT